MDDRTPALAHATSAANTALVRQNPRAVTRGTLKAEGPTFVVLAAGSAVILALLNFLPALSLGTLAEGL